SGPLYSQAGQAGGRAWSARRIPRAALVVAPPQREPHQSETEQQRGARLGDRRRVLVHEPDHTANRVQLRFDIRSLSLGGPRARSSGEGGTAQRVRYTRPSRGDELQCKPCAHGTGRLVPVPFVATTVREVKQLRCRPGADPRSEPRNQLSPNIRDL